MYLKKAISTFASVSYQLLSDFTVKSRMIAFFASNIIPLNSEWASK